MCLCVKVDKSWIVLFRLFFSPLDTNKDILGKR